MRTDCNKPIVQFTPLARRQVLAEFDAGSISSDGGVLLLREVDRRINLLDRVDQLIPDPRDPLHIEHDQRTLLAQRVLAIACGWEDLNDHATLRNDLVLQLATNRKAIGSRGDVDPDRPLASASTLCRLENRIDRQTCVRINQLLVEMFIESHKTPPTEIILDFDATDDPVHGKQEGRFFHGYYDEYCFLPLYVFAGEQLLCAYLRPANIDGAKHAWAILALITKCLRQAWPGVKIIFRGDSGFCRWKMLRWCDRHGVDYIVGLAKNPVLTKLSETLMINAENAFKETGQKQRLSSPMPPAHGTNSAASSPASSTRKKEKIPASSPPPSQAMVSNFTSKRTVLAAKWRTASKSSSLVCLPTAPAATILWPTSSGCCSVLWLTC